MPLALIPSRRPVAVSRHTSAKGARWAKMPSSRTAFVQASGTGRRSFPAVAAARKETRPPSGFFRASIFGSIDLLRWQSNQQRYMPVQVRFSRRIQAWKVPSRSCQSILMFIAIQRHLRQGDRDTAWRSSGLLFSFSEAFLLVT